MNKAYLIPLISLLLVGLGNNAVAQSDDKLVVLETDLGTIVMEFFTDDAPNHVDNFVGLAESGFYDGVVFHRIIPGFMIQGGDPNTVSGDPNTWGTGGPGTNVDAEFNTIKHNRGIISMARSADPNSGGSQFFIVHKDSNFLDEQYTVFGRIATEESFETLDKIASVETGSGDKPLDPEKVRITKAMAVNRSEVSNLLELSEPERLESMTPPLTDNRELESDELGITFSIPEGWTLQELEKTADDSPDLVAIGPKTGAVNPNISLTIQNTDQRTFDEIVAEKTSMLEELAASENLEIISQDWASINGTDAFVTDAKGVFSTEVGDVDVQFREVVFHSPEKYYVIVYANGLDDFASELPRFEETLNSFEILDSSSSSSDKLDSSSSSSDKLDSSSSSSDKLGDYRQTGNDTGAFEQVVEVPDEFSEGDGGCLIATATFGSELAPQVQQLREIRDNIILSTESGTAFMSGFNQIYYSFSPIIADLERENPLFKEAVKLSITPMLSTLSILNHVEINSESEMLSYGIGIILMNLGIYFAVPAVVIYKIRK